MDADNGNQSTGQHSAEPRRNTPGCSYRMFLQMYHNLHFNHVLELNISALQLGQPAMSEPLAGQPGSLLQPSEHSTQQNVMEVKCWCYVCLQTNCTEP